MNYRLNEKRKSELGRVINEVQMEEHIIPVEELCKRLNTDPKNVNLKIME